MEDIGHVTRREFIKLLMASLAVSACRAELPRGEPPTPLPTPTPTPPPSADGTVIAFLKAWEAGDYDAMYGMLSFGSRVNYTREQFVDYYETARVESTTTTVKTDVLALLTEQETASATFRTLWETTLFGPIESRNNLHMSLEGGGWGVAWSPATILPQLGTDLELVLLDVVPDRGNVYDLLHHAVATLGRMVNVGLVPGEVLDMPGAVNELSRVTGVPAQEIEAKINASRPDWFVSIADITFEESLANDEVLSSLEGVQRRDSTARLYPDKETGCHIIGHLGYIPREEVAEWQARGYRGDELVGLTGVEGWGEDVLAGRRGGRLVTLTPQRKEVALVAEAPPRPGGSIHLTGDFRLQAQAEAILGHRKGAIVALDPNSGDVFAMASYPRFDPGVFATSVDPASWAALNEEEGQPLVNRATVGAYPPASIFKIISTATAIEKLGLTEDSMFTCNGTWDGLGKGFEKSCWLKSGHGRIDLFNGLVESCDVVFYEIGLAAYTTDKDMIPSMARAFGLGQLTGIKGVEETAGLVPDEAWKREIFASDWYPGDAVNQAIGQGYMLTTPLQTASLIAAIGNGGTIYRPNVVRYIGELTGEHVATEPQVAARLPLKADTLLVIRRALEAVVSGKRGTAREAFEGASFTVAGKTGTAETGTDAEPHAWFAGYAPAEAPRVAIAVVIENGGEGSKEAAPLFRMMAEAFFAWEAARP